MGMFLFLLTISGDMDNSLTLTGELRLGPTLVSGTV